MPVMAEQPDNIILVYLRRIDEKVDRLTDAVSDVKHRMTSIETQVATLHGSFAGQSPRMDRIEARLERIERRLGLIEA